MPSKTQKLPVLPLTQAVVLPRMSATIPIDSEDARAAVRAALSQDGLLLLLPKVDSRYATVGVAAKIEEKGNLPDGTEVVAVVGRSRAVLGDVTPEGGALWAQVEMSPDPSSWSERARQLMHEYRAIVENILEVRGAPQVAQMLRGIENPGHLADMSGYSPDFSQARKVEILETLDVEERLEKLIGWYKEVLAELSLKEQVRSEVSERMEKTQREFLLRQQMEAIKKQLGEGGGDVVAEYRARAEKTGMPEGARKEFDREVDRLERMSEQSPEYGWIRNFLDWMLDVPWNQRTEDNFDLVEARRILDEDHSGLDDVKDRIIEFLAVRKRRQQRGLVEHGGRGSGAIITLVGPPGVGKTSLGESVARALGRKFARISLGGIHDEAEVRGHRRTYIGALPGRIVRALKEAGTKNPVIMLDEIDKVGADWRGDPSSALLEVLDPAQNHTFRDHYLEVDLDLSDVLFIPTANVADTIPGPLLDRMELIRLDGYTEAEKLEIARNHLVPRQLERNGLDGSETSITNAAINRVISDYTREAGVRSLERELGKVFRKVTTRIDSGQLTPPVTVDEALVRDALGKPRYQFEEIVERTAVPGVATGLAVTGTGGDVLFIEATALPGEPKMGLTLTGQLGDVMKESAQIALSYVRSHAHELGLEAGFGDKQVHIHVPAGAVPKDGPSAGVAMTTALVSLLSGRPVRSTVGMTGEVTLQGKVLPIGGVKQKALAAKRSGLKEVILPKRNEPDLDDLPAAVREELKIHLVSDVTEALRLALEPAPSPPVPVQV
ncbi:MAG TPA: endopeptidase La [Candidatus Dormibacteraeota bacterium]|nr:endopeptidase La [Candidatus Dormibacteraeota bacterium]